MSFLYTDLAKNQMVQNKSSLLGYVCIYSFGLGKQDVLKCSKKG
jgi:hypothetical protein